LLKAGSIIGGRYVLGRLIGKGGMSTVHEATHQQLGKKVAIKLLTGGYNENPSTIKRFQQEAQIAGNIGHPNICAVMDFGTTDDGVPYLVMENLEGESLAAMLKRDGTVPVDDALRITLQALEALEEVHSRGVVHRDLKPGNLFITSARGYGMIVKLLDFGISKVMQSTTKTSLTQTGTTLGTPNYMSPEQIREAKVIDQRADLYSIGVILFKMLSGRAPYEGGPVTETILKIMEEPVPSLAEAAPDTPPALVSLVLRSMQKDPAQRFQTAHEFKEEIKKIQADLGYAAPTPSVRTSVREPAGSEPGAQEEPRDGRGAKIAWVVGAAVLAALCVVGAVLLYPHLKGKAQDVQGGKKEEGGRAKLVALGGQQPQHDAAPPEQIPAKGSGEARKARIDFIGVPEDVAIECKACEGAVVGPKTLEVNMGDEEISILLSADEYEKKYLKLVPSRDMTVDVTLVPLSAGKPKQAKKKKIGGAAGSTGGGEKEPGDIDHVWDYPSK
jgi:hypothetical protein